MTPTNTSDSMFDSSGTDAILSGSFGVENGKRQRCSSDLQSDQTSPIKRARASTTDSETDCRDTEMALVASLRIKRDPTYYMEDGSCILLVEDTLFNVHRSILSKDTSSFSTMFTLPQGGQEAEGRSDENPIILTGDMVSEFRNFLWALYALPPELRVATSPDADLNQLIDIARVSNKYSFKSLETWALDAIHEYVNRKPSPILSAIPTPHAYTYSSDTLPQGSCAGNAIRSIEQLTKLIRLAQMCGHEPLLATTISYLRQLMSSSLQYAYLAMTLADELDIRTLRGVAYLEVMQKAVLVKVTKADTALKSLTQPHSEVGTNAPCYKEGDVDDEGRLIINRSQQLRLLSGYYRLTGIWERFRTKPPHFDHSSSCGATWHQHGCTQSWLDFWTEKTRTDAILSIGLADVLGRLKHVQKEYDRWGSAPYMHHDCRNAARKGIQEAVKKIEDALPDFFDAGDEA